LIFKKTITIFATKFHRGLFESNIAPSSISAAALLSDPAGGAHLALTDLLHS